MKRLLTALAAVLALVILAGCDSKTSGCKWAEQRRADSCPMNAQNVWNKQQPAMPAGSEMDNEQANNADVKVPMWKVSHLGGAVILRTADDVAELIRYEENNGAEYKCELIYMSESELKALPEFTGF